MYVFIDLKTYLGIVNIFIILGFLINHSYAYNIAIVIALTEYFIEFYFFTKYHYS